MEPEPAGGPLGSSVKHMPLNLLPTQRAEGAGILIHQLPSHWWRAAFRSMTSLALLTGQLQRQMRLSPARIPRQGEAAAGRWNSGCVHRDVEAQEDMVKAPAAAARAFQAEGTPCEKAPR